MEIRDALMKREQHISSVLNDFFEMEIQVSRIPLLTEKQFWALKFYNFELFFFPKIDILINYPNWEFPLEEYYWDDFWDGSMERTDLPGAWLAIEIIEKPDYGKYTNDELMHDIGINTRFGHNIKVVNGVILPLVAKKLGFESSKVRLPYLIEWNLIGNVFFYLKKLGYCYPDMGNGIMGEYCRNVIDCPKNKYYAHTSIGLNFGEEGDNGLGRIHPVADLEIIKNTMTGRMSNIESTSLPRPYGFRIFIEVNNTMKLS